MKILTVLLVLVSVLLANGVPGQTGYKKSVAKETVDSLMFREPTSDFHPHIWFHFISGNISLPGIKEDIRAIHEAGFSGIQLFHEHRGGDPWPGVEPQIKCLGKEWDEMIRQVARECDRYGMKFTMQNCPGWAMAGGPWIEPENAMRHLVWSRTDIEGGKPVKISLPQPDPRNPEWRDYRDVAVIAFPTPEGDTNKPLTPVTILSNRKNLDWEKWIHDERDSPVILEASDNPTWVEVIFNEQVTLRTVEFPPVRSFYHGWEYDPHVEVKIEALYEDQPGETIADFHVPRSNWQENKPLSIGCGESTSKRYRLSITNSRYRIQLNPVRFYSAARKTNWEGEAAWVLRDMAGLKDPEQSEDSRIKRKSIVNLSAAYDKQGYLNWQVPPGSWTILRWGHVNTGTQNGSAPYEATGFECNKLSVAGADAHFKGYIGRLTGADGPLGGNLLKGLLMDSWECGTQTWTDGMEEEFRKRRGYDLMAWLPAIAGYLIDDPETTSRFLRDWRATVNDLLVANFYGRMTELAHERGLTTYYETASGDVFPADILEYYKHADVPMCEFWHPRTDFHVGSIEKKSVKPTVSASRLYGKNRVAAESFTSGNLTWNEHPGMLKPTADFYFAKGVTYPVLQAYTHAPWKNLKPPGSSFGGNTGTPFLRGQTWWGKMPEFTKYLSRCTYMLESGRPVSDVLFYLGDEIGYKPRQNRPFPDGYQYDYCNTDILLHRLSVRNGRLETPEGLSYPLLWLPTTRKMLPETIERLISLVKDGAIIVGNPPESVATLSGGAGAEARFNHAVEALWGKTKKPHRRLGKGMILSNITLDEALDKLNIEPDLTIEKVHSGCGDDLLWIHRQNNTEDWYFMTVPEGQGGFDGLLKFRAKGKAGLWDPLTGKVTTATTMKTTASHTFVDIKLPPSGSVFILFKPDKHFVITGPFQAAPETVVPVTGPWKLKFPDGWGAPDPVSVDTLSAWKDLDISPEAKAFSGSVLYQTSFNLGTAGPKSKVLLDMGEVNMIASVRINGTDAGTVWCNPHQIDITNKVRNGLNFLEIEVTSTWFNRLVYDAGLDKSQRKSWTINGPPKEEHLLPYGLLGPVRLKILQRPDSI
ncbi:MAG: glycosyl hydrolase [Mangrovibacterium sp.]|nr:glycosyl hydrolase [Mangrovibacterium sp.]